MALRARTSAEAQQSPLIPSNIIQIQIKHICIDFLIFTYITMKLGLPPSLPKILKGADCKNFNQKHTKKKKRSTECAEITDLILRCGNLLCSFCVILLTEITNHDQ